jgi:putative component of toxin-antitoxin plasmid stabilization module
MLVLLTGGIYEIRLEMGSGGTIYIPGFINIDSGVRELLGGGGYSNRHTDIR